MMSNGFFFAFAFAFVYVMKQVCITSREWLVLCNTSDIFLLLHIKCLITSNKPKKKEQQKKKLRKWKFQTKVECICLN